MNWVSLHQDHMVPMIALLSILMSASISPQMVKGQRCISAMQLSLIVCKDACILFCLTLCNPLDCSLPGPLSMGIFKQEYWSGLPFLPPGDLPDPGIEPESPASLTLAGGLFTTEPPGKSQKYHSEHYSILMSLALCRYLLRTANPDAERTVHNVCAQWWRFSFLLS